MVISKVVCSKERHSPCGCFSSSYDKKTKHLPAGILSTYTGDFGNEDEVIGRPIGCRSGVSGYGLGAASGGVMAATG